MKILQYSMVAYTMWFSSCLLWAMNALETLGG